MMGLGRGKPSFLIYGHVWYQFVRFLGCMEKMYLVANMVFAIVVLGKLGFNIPIGSPCMVYLPTFGISLSQWIFQVPVKDGR